MRAASPTTTQSDPPTKPLGGYRIITLPLLAAVWVAYKLKIIRLVDLRVWFAAQEMDARRCRLEPALPKKYTLAELRKLTGLSPRRVKESLRRLKEAGLILWAEEAMLFPGPGDHAPVSETPEFRVFLGRISCPDRKVPVPRRTIRLIAGGARPVLIAAMLGHMIRGLYLKGGKCSPRGRVKASWIADTFGVALRRVKEARRELIASGWLIPLEADQWALNRWGAHFRINLQWSRLDPIKAIPKPTMTTTSQLADDTELVIDTSEQMATCPELAPPPAISRPELAPPESYGEPLNGRDKNQKPASGGPAGIYIPTPKAKRPEPQTASPTIATPPSPPPVVSSVPVAQTPATAQPESRVPEIQQTPPLALGKPDLRNVVIEDLRGMDRLLELYTQAMALGLVTSSERDRLRFVGAAEHARVIGTKNPCGLFVRLIRNGLWSFLTQDDEDAANARLKRHLYGKPPEGSAPKVEVVRAAEFLSEDAVIVRTVRSAVLRAGYRGDAFPLLMRQHPEWTRERWDVAVAELESVARNGRR